MINWAEQPAMMITALCTWTVKIKSDDDHRSLRRDTVLITSQWVNWRD